MTQCHIRLLDGRKGATHRDDNSCNRRMLVADVPVHNDIADSPDSHTRGIADGAAKNMYERYHPVSEAPVEREVFT